MNSRAIFRQLFLSICLGIIICAWPCDCAIASKDSVPSEPSSPEATESTTKATGPIDASTSKESPRVLEGTRLNKRQRRSIWKERVHAERRARRDARAKYPNRYSLVDTLPVGTIIHLSDTTYLMPDYDPDDVWVATKVQKTVLPGATATVIGVVIDKSGFLWYETEILEYPIRIGGTTDTGWVIASGLMSQMPVENFLKSIDLEDFLRQVYIKELLHQHNISKLQLDSISWEAEREQWPLPDVE